jgi:hypothetical protein
VFDDIHQYAYIKRLNAHPRVWDGYQESQYHVRRGLYIKPWSLDSVATLQISIISHEDHTTPVIDVKAKHMSIQLSSKPFTIACNELSSLKVIRSDMFALKSPILTKLERKIARNDHEIDCFSTVSFWNKNSFDRTLANVNFLYTLKILHIFRFPSNYRQQQSLGTFRHGERQKSSNKGIFDYGTTCNKRSGFLEIVNV